MKQKNEEMPPNPPFIIVFSSNNEVSEHKNKVKEETYEGGPLSHTIFSWSSVIFSVVSIKYM